MLVRVDRGTSLHWYEFAMVRVDYKTYLIYTKNVYREWMTCVDLSYWGSRVVLGATCPDTICIMHKGVLVGLLIGNE